MRGGSRLVGGSNEMKIEKRHTQVGYGKAMKARGKFRGAGQMMRGGAAPYNEGGGAAPSSVAVEQNPPNHPTDIAGFSNEGALGVGEAYTASRRLNPRPQRYDGPIQAPMRLYVDNIQIGHQ